MVSGSESSADRSGADSAVLDRSSSDCLPEPRVTGFAALIWATVITLVYSALPLAVGIAKTGWQQPYNLDDTYIHLAISRNLAYHGVWGINPGEFAGASSSPLWTVVLAGAIKLFGTSIWLPFILNIVIVPFVMLGLWAMLRRFVSNQKALVALMVLIGALIPIPMLIMNSMEQTLQIALVLGLLLALAKVFAGGDGTLFSIGNWRHIAVAMVLAALSVGARFESLFVVFIACGLLVLNKRVIPAVLIGAAAWVTVGLYALYSFHAGGAWLPYSVLIKGNHLDSLAPAAVWAWLRVGLVKQMIYTLVTPIWGSAILLTLMLWRDKSAASRVVRFLLLTFVGSTLLHAQFALLFLLYRYEAYLFAVGGVTVGAAVALVLSSQAWAQKPSARYAVIGLFAVLNVPTLLRPLMTDYRMAFGARNIQQQQVQMGKFLHEYYAGTGVAANDIGAVSWYGGAHITDLWGLGSRNVFEARRRNTYTTESIAQITRDEHAEIAVIYPEWFTPFGGIPKDWKVMGVWTMPHNVAAASERVVFYAIKPEAEKKLAESLAAFEAEEPKLYGVAKHDGTTTPAAMGGK